MNDSDLNAALDLIHADLRRSPAPTSLYERVRTIPSTTPQQRGWLPRLDKGGFSMFSAVKFVVAGVIVALFGGFLLAGFLTTEQADVMAPAAVSESPSPMMTDDILPGVTLTVEAVEPGVYQVLGDGVRDLSGRNEVGIAVGHDGGVWVLRGQRFLRLGEGTHPWAVKQLEDVTDFEVALDGAVWAIDRPNEKEQWFIRSYDGETWTTHHTTSGVFYRDSHLEIGPDGRVWTAWLPEDGGRMVVGYFDGTDWQSIGEADTVALALSGTDEVWASGLAGVWSLHRYVDGAWDPIPAGVGDMDAAADGTFWGIGSWGPGNATGGLLRFEGGERSEWTWDDLGFEIEGGYGIGPRGPLEVAPDDSVWIGSPVAIPPTPMEGLDSACDGIRRFDGMTTEHFLTGLCVRELEVAADGSVWVLAGTGRQGTDFATDLYVIAPEAVAGSG